MTFLVQPEPLPEVMALVYAMGELNPLEQLNDVEKDLQPLGKGIVIFDLLLANGNTRNRYHLGLFDGAHFQDGRLRPLEDSGELRQVSAAFLKKNLSRLHLEMVSAPIEWAIRNGLGI